MNSLQEFVDYVWSFYAPNSDLYPIKGLTMDEVYAAIFEYKQRLLKVSYNNPEYVKAFGNNYTYGFYKIISFIIDYFWLLFYRFFR